MHRPGPRQIEATRIVRPVDYDAHPARTAQVGLQYLLESIHALRTVEFRGPPQPQAARIAFARPVDIHQRFRLQSPRLDEVVETQRAVDDQDGILDDDVAVLLKGLLVQADFEPRAAVIQDQGHAIRPAAYFQHQAG